MATLFISDLHLEGARPDIAGHFLRFLEDQAGDTEALYILGDLFESWLGDDDPDEHYAIVKRALGEVTRGGTQVFFMHGNRDFLIGKGFAGETSVQLLADPVVLQLYGSDVLVSHGDVLCTDDVSYQAFRTMVRNPEWQAMMLAKSLEERQAYAKRARMASKQHGSTIDMAISDVNQAAVEVFMRKHGVHTLLHGHTHRPAIHAFELDGRSARRIVLGDWYEQGSVLRWDVNGPVLEVLPR